MNKTIAKTGAAIVTLTTFLFLLCLVFDYSYGGFLVCIFLSIGYVMTAASFYYESDKDRKLPALIGVAFAAVYSTMIIVVYFTQLTSVQFDGVSGISRKLIDYTQGGLMFNLDLMGYGIMALSTFFVGMTLKGVDRREKVLKWLLIIHGVFFIACLIMPMTGMFSTVSNDPTGGRIALIFWCIYFLPIGVLSYLRFNKWE